MRRKRTVESLRRIDVRDLARSNSLSPGTMSTMSWGEDSILFRVRGDSVRFEFASRINGGPWENHKISVLLTHTRCHLGGRRVWFSCPRCGGRCAILFLLNGLQCRKCADLAYETQNERCPGFRLLMRARKIRQQLGMDPDSDAPIIWKPKWMRWHTFSRLALRERGIQQRAWAMIGSSLPWR